MKHVTRPGRSAACLLAWVLGSVAVCVSAEEFRVPAPAPQCRTNVASHTYCTPAEAIAAANARGGAHTIRLAQRAVYTVERPDHMAEGGNGLPAVTTDVTIEGDDAVLERADGAGIPAFRLLRVLPGGKLTLKNLTLRHGATGLGFDGAAAWNTGTLHVSGCTLEDNHSGDDGGAIRSDGELLVQDSVFRKNSAFAKGRVGGAGGVGGAIQTHTQFGRGRSRIERTVFEGNEADASGGALWLMGETTILQATFTGNRAGERGGGIINYAGLELRGSRLSDNRAVDAGGGIYAFGQATIVDTEIAGNHAGSAGDCDGHVSGCGTDVAMRGDRR